jgi:hypothetical protein
MRIIERFLHLLESKFNLSFIFQILGLLYKIYDFNLVNIIFLSRSLIADIDIFSLA